MKRRFLAVCCALALVLGAVPAAGALEGEARRAADILATLGLADDAGDLTAPATRGQAAELLVKLAGAEQEAAASRWTAGFLDVTAQAAAAVNYAARQGWITGVTATAFQPGRTVTANAWSAFLLRMLGYSDKDGDFTVADAARFAQRIGLFPTAWDGAMTLGDLYETAAAALTFSYRDGSGTVIGRMVKQGAVTRSAVNALGLLTPTLTARQAADRYASAVFCLQVYESQEALRENTPSAAASGFFIREDGLAVTNYHSIEGGETAFAILSTGEVCAVESVVYYDSGIDIAVLRIARTTRDGTAVSAFNHLDMVSTADVRPGDTVYTIGNPLGMGLAVSTGVISATDREVERYALPCIMNTADISKGSSGGALLNEYGQAIAVTSGAYLYGNNMYLAVPIDPVLTADLTVPGQPLAKASGAA